jgi:3-oxoacyl-[acyl-carrier protein] reductase
VPPYVTAKHGLEGLTKALAVEWAPDGIRVVSISPGYVVTPLVDEAMRTGDFDPSGPEGRTPLGRMAEPQEVAELVAFAASPQASYLTGASVVLDGGWLANGGW